MINKPTDDNGVVNDKKVPIRTTEILLVKYIAGLLDTFFNTFITSNHANYIGSDIIKPIKGSTKIMPNRLKVLNSYFLRKILHSPQET